MSSQEHVRALMTGASDSHSFRSRPDSFISYGSDIASEQDKSDNIDPEEGGPSSSTPMKDSTPTNQVSDHLEQFNDTEEAQAENSESQVIQIGEILEDKDIVESSDC